MPDEFFDLLESEDLEQFLEPEADFDGICTKLVMFSDTLTNFCELQKSERYAVLFV